MCIAIAKPKGIKISKETLQICWDANPHGAGFAFINQKDELIIRKHMSFTSFWNEFSIIDKAFGDTSNMLIHFRITSRGATRLDNCHPFKINDNMAFIHNGTITSMPVDKVHEHSDTYLFNETILKELPEGWEDSIGIKLLMEEVIGCSKIVILHKEKGFIILNEQKGVWADGIWYSNTGYKKYNYQATTWPKYGTEAYWKAQAKWNKNNNFDEVDAWLANKEKEKEALKLLQEKPTTTVDTESDVLVQCAHCNNWVSDSEVFIIKSLTSTGGVDFICEECGILSESSGIELDIVFLDEEALAKVKQEQGYIV